MMPLLLMGMPTLKSPSYGALIKTNKSLHGAVKVIQKLFQGFPLMHPGSSIFMAMNAAIEPDPSNGSAGTDPIVEDVTLGLGGRALLTCSCVEMRQE